MQGSRPANLLGATVLALSDRMTAALIEDGREAAKRALDAREEVLVRALRSVADRAALEPVLEQLLRPPRLRRPAQDLPRGGSRTEVLGNVLALVSALLGTGAAIALVSLG